MSGDDARRGRSGGGRGTTGGRNRAAAPARGPGSGPRPRFADQRPASTLQGDGVDVHDPDGIRLQKVLAQAGLGSRRACENLISAGRVIVDGSVVTELGVRVDPATAVIHVDGMRLQLDETLVYLAFNKPAGVVSTMNDPEGRPCLADYVTDRTERLFHVGRLDADSEGLLLLTNDGNLAHRLQHPSYEVPKTYLAEVPGPLARDVGARLRAGVELEDGVVSADDFKVVDSTPGKALVQVVLHEGRQHVVRRMLAEVGHPVERLVRTQIGPIRLGELKQGRYRVLVRDELGQLLADVGM